MPLLLFFLLLTSDFSYSSEVNKCPNHTIENANEEQEGITEYCKKNILGEFDEDIGTDCAISRNEAVKCCRNSTASSCLKGEAKGMFKKIQTNPLTQMGTIIGAQVLGAAGMSEMCASLNGLMGLGNAVAMSMSGNCQSAISSCEEICTNKIAEVCEKYESCTLSIGGTTCSENECKSFQEQLQSAENKKNTCQARTEKPAEFANGANLILQTGNLAEQCRLFASGKKKGSMTEVCVGPNCDSSPKKEECTDPNGCEEDPLSPPSGLGNPSGGPGRVSLTPPDLRPPTTTNPSSSGTSHSYGGGGAQTGKATGRDRKGYASQIKIPGESNASGLSGEETTGSSTLGSSSGGSGGLSGSPRSASKGNFGSSQEGANESEEEGGAKLSGGGFKGYGGGGRRGKRKPSSSLKLSKDQLKKLAKKEGPKRKLPGLDKSEGGVHENIFERISKRYQISCEKKRLICE